MARLAGSLRAVDGLFGPRAGGHGTHARRRIQKSPHLSPQEGCQTTRRHCHETCRCPKNEPTGSPGRPEIDDQIYLNSDNVSNPSYGRLWTILRRSWAPPWGQRKQFCIGIHTVSCKSAFSKGYRLKTRLGPILARFRSQKRPQIDASWDLSWGEKVSGSNLGRF